MGIDIRSPNITASTEREQLLQMKSYLFQLAEQLQWALQNVDTSNKSVVVAPTAKSLASSSQEKPSAEATFGSIKALIIKSADIVNAYYEEINKKLEGQYVAISDFGIFSEQTSQEIVENSTNINRTFNNIQEIQTGFAASVGSLAGEIGQVSSKVGEVETNLLADLKTIKDDLSTISTSLIDVTANIKTGLLYYDDNEVPVYGLEVGQKNTVNGVEVFNKFARFTADRLAFYNQSGAEVAYISDYKLYITDVEIKGSLQAGGYKDIIDADGGIVTKWAGRS
jgi:hypothetical protein